MKSINTFIKEVLVKHNMKQEVDTNVSKWFDKCKDFCTAGTWSYTNMHLGPTDFNPDLFNDALEFDINHWPVDDKTKQRYKDIVELSLLLYSYGNDDEILALFKKYDNNYGNYWFQNFTYRTMSNCKYKEYEYVMEALLLISFAIKKGCKKNYWQYSDFTYEKIYDIII